MQEAYQQPNIIGLVSPCAYICILHAQGFYLASLAQLIQTISMDFHSRLELSPAAKRPFPEMVGLGRPYHLVSERAGNTSATYLWRRLAYWLTMELYALEGCPSSRYWLQTY